VGDGETFSSSGSDGVIIACSISIHPRGFIPKLVIIPRAFITN